jgi:hypothetical protein
MPCRDYESDNGYSQREQYKEQCDKLARIACAAMEELVRQGKAEFLVLKNEELREWWEAHLEADRKEKARIAEKERRERVKREALERLTDEEKELLGLSKPKKKKVVDSYVMDIEEWHKDAIEEYQKYSNNDILRILDVMSDKTKKWG